MIALGVWRDLKEIVSFGYFEYTAPILIKITVWMPQNQTFREIKVNARFNEYATHAGFRIHASEGYDPESKGKVESGVKYVKQNALYGKQFADWSELEAYMRDWLDNIVNQCLHGAAGKVPFHHYEQMEKDYM